uniref:carbohydrate sulfotransferase 1-like n=1 Tax=Myxine glutinosa TaxID=7769 RepID=UPI00358FE403
MIAYNKQENEKKSKFIWCSWRILAILMFLTIGIQYVAVKTIRSYRFENCYVSSGTGYCSPNGGQVSHWFGCPRPDPSNNQPTEESASRKHILILATTRSGSSFLGQFFNQNPDIFYLYEPLYHIEMFFGSMAGRLGSKLNNKVLVGAFRDLLRNVFDCELHSLEPYMKPFPQHHQTKHLFRRAASTALCSPPLCPAEDAKDESVCAKRCSNLNLTLAAEVCQKRAHVVLKTVRFNNVADLRFLAEDSRLDLKVIHLVRDPRAVLSSKMVAFQSIFKDYNAWKKNGAMPPQTDTSLATAICKTFLPAMHLGLKPPAWLNGRYMLVRYEDLAREPLEKAREIYEFVGLPLEPIITNWIVLNTHGTEKARLHHLFSTYRDSAKTAENWRLSMDYNIAQFLQNACNETFAELGYRSVSSLEELRNINTTLVEERNFTYFT